MKAIKRHLATVLAAIMIFTTIGNAYVSAKASGDTLDSFGEDAGTHEITVTDQGEVVAPSEEVTETAPLEEVTPETDLPLTDAQEPVVTDQTDVPETEITDVPETEVVNEDASVVVVNYDAGVGGSVDYPTESFRSDDTQIQLYGSQAMPESGYIFKNWIRTETGEVVSTEQIFVPDSEEVKWMLGHTADAGGEINVSYTAQFVAVASEYEEILPNVIKVKIYVSEGAFDREVELVVEELQSDTQQYIDAEQALIDAEVEYTGMMAFDIHFEDVETGEEIEPAGPVKMEYEILRRQIRKTISETDGLDEITSETQIQMHHMVETENARTGEKELAVETIADSTIATGEVVQNDDLADPTAGLDRYGVQETVSMDVTTDRNDNVTGMSGDVVLNGFSVFTFTVNGNNPAGAGTYEVPGVRIVKNNGAFTRANYETAEYITGTAIFSKDGRGSRLVNVRTDDGKNVEFLEGGVYWVQANNWSHPLRGVTDWSLKINNDQSFEVNPIVDDPNVTWDVVMYNSTNANQQYGDQYYFLTNDESLFGNGLAEGEIAAYVYTKGTGAGQITVNGVNYVPASPKVTAVTFSGRSAFLRDFDSFASVYRKTDSGYAQVKRFNSAYNGENGWITAVTEDDNADHRYYRTRTKEDASREYIWLLEDDNSILEGDELPTGKIKAHIYLLMDAIYSPQPLHKGYNKGLFGPYRNNTEAFTVTIDLDALNRIMRPEVIYSGNQVHYYYSYRSHKMSNPTTSEYLDIESTSTNGHNFTNQAQAEQATRFARNFFDDVIMDPSVMPNAADREKFSEYFGKTQNGNPNYIGYVLKREGDHYNGTGKSWHIDGIGREFPIYMLMLYEARNANHDPQGDKAAFATHTNMVPDQFWGSRRDRDPKTGDRIDVNAVAIDMFEKYFRQKYGQNIDIQWDWGRSSNPDDVKNITTDKIWHGVITTGTKQIDFNIAPMVNRRNSQTDTSVDDTGKIGYETILQDQFWLAQIKVWFTERDTGTLQINKKLEGDGKSNLYGKELTFSIFQINNEAKKLYFKNTGDNQYSLMADSEVEAYEKDVQAGKTDPSVSVGQVKLVMPAADEAHITITGLTPGTMYRVEEARDFTEELENNNYSITIAGSPEATKGDKYGKHARLTKGIEKGKISEVTITNTIDKGKGTLIVEKVFTGSGANDAFINNIKNDLKFTLYDEDGNKVTGLGGAMSTLDNTEYAQLTSLKERNAGDNRKGGGVTFTDVPQGTYFVVETGAEVDGYDLTKKLNNNVISTVKMEEGSEAYINQFRVGSVKVNANGTATLTLENNYVPNKGTLKLTKTWTGDGAAIAKAKSSVRFTIYRYVSNTRREVLVVGGKEYADLTWTDLGGTAAKSESTLTINNVEPGLYYVVEEGAGASGHINAKDFIAYNVTVTGAGAVNGDMATVEAQGTGELHVINDYERILIPLEGTKKWDDNKNEAEKRPAKIKVRVKAFVDGKERNDINGVPVSQYTYEIEGDKNAETWKISIPADTNYTAPTTTTGSKGGLPKYTVNGQEFVYRLVEIDEDGNEIQEQGMLEQIYSVSYSEDGLEITNKLDPELNPTTGGSRGKVVPGHQKWVEKSKNANGEWDGTYDLTLTVDGAQGSEENKAQIDVLFVTDFSGSMAHNMGNNQTASPQSNSRMENLKNVVNRMIATIHDNKGIDARYSIVSFAGDRPYQNGYYYDSMDTPFNDSEVVAGWTAMSNTNDFLDFASKIDVSKIIDQGGGTNYMAALRQAKDQMNRHPADRKDAQTVVIFVSDGAPTFWYEGRGYTRGTGYENAGNIESAYDAMLPEAAGLTSDRFYTVLVGPDATWFGNKSTSQILKDVSGEVDALITDNFHATSTEQLQTIFNQITAEIQTIDISSVTVHDTLSGNAEFVEGNAGLLLEVYEGNTLKFTSGPNRPDNNATLTFEDEGKQVTMKAVRGANDFTLTFEPADYKLNPKYSYRVTAHVEPTQAAYDDYVRRNGNYPDNEIGDPGTHEHARETGYYSNNSNIGSTYLKYKYDGVEYTDKYPKPVLRLLTLKYSVEKKFENTTAALMPSAVEIGIYEEGSDTLIKKVTLGASNNWKDSFTGLRRWRHGQEISYVMKEIGEDGGKITLDSVTGNEVTFTVNYGEVTGNATAGYNQVITNTLGQGTIKLQKTVAYDESVTQMTDADKALIKKALEDNLTFSIYKEGQGTPFATIRYVDMKPDAANDLVRTHTLNADPGKYSVIESNGAHITGYELTIGGDNDRDAYKELKSNGNIEFAISNTYKKVTGAVQVTKIWEDDSDRDGTRPDTLTLQLYERAANGNVTPVSPEQKVTFKKSDNRNKDVWTHSFTNLPESRGGVKIDYVVRELDQNGNMIKWNGKLPSAKEGREYDVTYDGLTVTNSITPEPTSVPYKKTWVDESNRDGVRPKSIRFGLFKGDSENPVETVDLDTTQDEHGGAFTDLFRYENGKEINYVVKEYDTVTRTWIEKGSFNGNYTAASTKEDDGTFHFTNSYTPETYKVVVIKKWDDNGNRDNQRPDELEVTLKANNVPVVFAANDTDATHKNSVKLTGQKRTDDGWTYTWENLPKNENGKPVSYSVEETLTNGYRQKDVRTTVIRENGVEKGIQFEITNDRPTDVRTVKVVKVWDDDGDRDGARPQSVRVRLTATYKEDGQVKTIDLANWEQTSTIVTELLISEPGWSYIWNNLPVNYDGGFEINYTVDELVRDANGNYVPGEIPGYKKQVIPADTDEDGTMTTTFTVTNTYETKKVKVPVEKIWDDNNDQDKKRPADGVVVELWADGAFTGLTKELKASDGWKATFESTTAVTLYKYANGKEITYTIKERAEGANTTLAVGEAYNADYKVKEYGRVAASAEDTEKGIYAKLTVTNEHETAKTQVKAKKVWADDNNRDKKRPAFVTFGLFVGNATTPMRQANANTVEGSNESEWVIFDDLDLMKNGTAIDYTIKELNAQNRWIGIEELNKANGSVPYNNDYDIVSIVKGTDGNDTTFTVTNSHEPDQIRIEVLKKWDDNDNYAKLRPNKVTVHLFADDKEIQSAELSAQGGWKASWDGLDVNKKGAVGEAIVYTVTEDAVGNGYQAPSITSSEIVNGVKTFTVENTYDLEYVKVRVKKIWVDEDNVDGLRPTTLGVQLYSVETDAQGNPVKDANDNYVNMQPEGAPVSLTKDTEGEAWYYEWPKLDKIRDGKEVYYVVDEVAVPEGYTKSVTGDMETRYEITNTHPPKTTSVSVEKIWEDEDDRFGKRPQTIRVQLYADGVAKDAPVTLPRIENGAEVWNHTWTGLPENKPGAVGQKITYTVDEVVDDGQGGFKPGEISGYTKQVTGDATTGFVITNTIIDIPLSITVKKAWNDADNQDNVRPEIEVQLLADGEPVKTAKLEASNGYTKTWTSATDGIAKYRAGKQGELVVYTVQEVGEANGKIAGKNTTDGRATEYTVTYQATPAVANNNKGVAHDGTMVITNSYTPEEMEIVAVKTWDDDNDRADKRPPELAFILSKDGVVYDTQYVTGNETTNEGWTYTWKNLPKYDKGRKINYTVAEGSVPDYTARKDDPVRDPADAAADVNKITFSFENKYEPGKVDVKVIKNWNDGDDQDAVRPGSIQVQLQRRVKNEAGAQWTNVGEAVTIGKDTTPNAWQHTFAKQDMFVAGAQGKEYEYRVIEVGANVQDNKYVIDAAEDRYYTISYSKDANDENTTIINNDYTPETVDVIVRKVWDDNNDQDGKQPKKVVVQLFADDKAYLGEVELNAENGWEHTYKNLPKYNHSTTPVDYTFLEHTMTEGGRVLGGFVENNGDAFMLYSKDETKAVYTGAYSEDTVTKDGKTIERLTVTNSHTPETIDIPVVKVWKDTNYTDMRPADITLVLTRKDGKNLPAGVTAEHVLGGSKEDDEWSYTWEDLPKYEDGKIIEYVIDEKEIPAGYTKLVTGDMTKYVITNTYQTKPIDIPVTKIWEDANDYDDIRPTSITVGLFANGKLVKDYQLKATDVVEGKPWSYVFEGMDQRDENGAITYTIGELKAGGLKDDMSDWILTEAWDAYNADYEGKVDQTAREITNRHDHEIDKSVKRELDPDYTEDVKLEENTDNFEYKIDTAIPDRKTLKSFVITDDLNGLLTIVSTEAQIKASLPDAVRDKAEVKITGNTVTISWQFAEGEDPNITYINQELKGEKVSAVVKAKFTNPDNIDLTAEGVVAGKVPNRVRYNIDNDPKVESKDVWVQPKQEETEVPVTKIWDDQDNYDKVRPTNITVGVLAPATQGSTELAVIAHKTINATNKDVNGKEWSYKFTGLVKNYPDGTLIPYTIGELIQNGDADDMNDWILVSGNLNADYQTFVDQDAREITNRHNPKIDKEVKGESEADTAYSKEDFILSKAGEKFDYRVSTAIPATDSKGDPTTKFEITDQLTDALVFESTADQVVVKVAGAEVTGANRPAVVINEKTLKVTFEGAALQNALNKAVTVEFRASIDPEADLTQYVETMDGKIPNDVDYRINLDDPVPSEKVWVKPFDEKINIPVKKIWEDANNYDKKRPENLTVGLFRNTEDNLEGATLVASETISGTGSEWNYEFKDQPLRQTSGKPYYYFVGELKNGGNKNNAADWIKTSGAFMLGGKDAEGNDIVVYAGTVDQTAREITNRHDHEIDKEVKKANGTWEGEIKLENNKEVFEYKFGTAIPDRKDLETFVITDDIHSEMTIVSTVAEVKASLPDAVRDAAEVDITGNTVKISWKFAEVNGTNITYMNQNLKGLEVSAVVKAQFKNPDNIDLTADGVVAGRFPNTVRYNIDDEDDHWSNDVWVQPKQEETEVPVTKIWDDANNYDKKRPTNITVGVFAPKEQGGTELVLAADPKTINASNKDVDGKEWSYKFTGLVKNYPDGTAIPYTIGELVQNGNKDDMNDWILESGNLNADYQTFVDQDANEITNRHDPKIDKEVKGESQAETAYTKEDYALTKAGEKFDYRASTAIPATDSNGDPTTKFEITDQLTDALVFESTADQVVVKVADQTVTGANRPAVAIDDATKTLTVTFEGDALANAIGKKVTVEFRASIDPEADLTQYVEQMDGKIPNDVDYRINLDDPVPSEKVWVKPFSEKIDIPVVKVWEDANNYDNIRPSVITVGLFIGDTLQSTKQIQVTDTAVDGRAWSVKWEGLDKKYANGKDDIPYIVKEQAADGTWIALSGNYNDGYKANVAGDKDNGYTITNTHDSKIEKDINGATEYEVKTPEEPFTYTIRTAVTDKLWAKSFTVEDTLEGVLEFVSSEADVKVTPAGGKVTIEGQKLTVHFDLADEDGDETNGVQNALKGQKVEITFDAKFVKNPDMTPYTTGKVPNHADYKIDNVFTERSEDVYVTPKGEKISIPVEKIWIDADNYDNIRPTVITVGLFIGDEKLETKQITEAGEDGKAWSVTFKDLLKNNTDGSAKQYVVKELKQGGVESNAEDWIERTGAYNDQYVSEVEGSKDAGYKITNTHDHKIEKDVNGKTDHELETPNEVFKYTIKTAITDKVEAKQFKITDTLEPVLEFVSSEADVKVSPAGGKVSISGQTLTVIYDLADEDGDETNGVQNALKGQKVEISFEAKVMANADLTPYHDGTVASNGKVPNKATYTIDNDFTEDSEPVYVHPKRETVNIPVIKIWDDAENYDKVRPTTITVGVFKGDTFVEARDITIDKTEVNGQPWSVLFEGLPKNELNGDIINYTVRELKAGASRESRNLDDWITTGAYSTKEITKADGTTETVPVYTVTVTQNNNENVEEGFKVTNRHDHKIDKAVQKANGEWTGRIELEDNAETFSYQFKTAIPTRETLNTFVIRDTLDDLLVFENGNATNVVIEPQAAAEKADVKIDGQNLTITWTFAEGQDPNVTYINQELKGTNLEITVNAKFANPDQIDMTKTVEGSVPNKVRYSIDGELEKESDDVWVTPQQNWIRIPVQKDWLNDADKQNLRPGAITIGLFKRTAEGDTEVHVTDITNRTNWFYEFGKEGNAEGKLPAKEADGTEITYVVKEQDAEGNWIDVTGTYNDVYTVTIDNGNKVADPDGKAGDLLQEVSIANKAETNEITVEKVWDDENDRDGVRDTVVNVGLFRTIGGIEVDVDEPYLGIKQLRERNNWRYTWPNLPLSENGEKITYTVKEQRRSDYEWIETGVYKGTDENPVYTVTPGTKTEGTGNDAKEIRTLINTHIPEPTEVNVEKIWDDLENQDGVRPESIKVYVLADGVELTGTYTPKTIVNGAVVEGEAVAYEQTLNEANGWKFTWAGLPKYAEGGVGKEVVYTVLERELDGYETTYADGKNSTVITNKLKVTKLTVKKDWDDKENQDGVRPNDGAVTVRLYRVNGEERVLMREVELNKDNGYTYTWENLPQYDKDQNEIKYVVVELDGENEVTDVMQGLDGQTYTVTYDPVAGSVAAGYTALIHNSYTPEVVEVEAEKIWDDMDNKDNIRPTELTLTLYANGHPVTEDQDGNAVENPVKIGPADANNNKDGAWTTAKWSNLPKYANGNHATPILYTVDETGRPEAYTHRNGDPVDYRLEKLDAEGAEAADNDAIVKYGITLWNRYIPDQTQYKVVKVWDDADNQDGFRDTVYVQLYTKDAEGNLTKVDDYEYYDVEKNEDGTAKIVNNRVVREKNPTVVKTFVEITPEEGNSRQVVTWVGLPKHVPGTKNELVYTVMEVTAEGEPIEEGGTLLFSEDTGKAEYTVNYVDDAEDKYSRQINNKHVPYTTEIKVGKVWGDANDQDGIRPASIEIKLTRKTDSETLEPITVNLTANDKMVDGEAWTYIFNNNGEGLPMYHKGEKITYEVVESEVPEGYAVRYGVIEEVQKIENAHNPDPKKTIEESEQLTKLAEDKAMLKLRTNTFTFAIEAAVPELMVNNNGEVEELTKFVIADKVIDDIQIVSTPETVVVEGVKGVVAIDGQTLTVTYEGDALEKAKGTKITVKFDGKLKDTADLSQYLQRGIDGFPNTAEAQFNPDDEDGVTLETKPVTITPPDPEIEKEVALAEGSEGEVFKEIVKFDTKEETLATHAKLATRDEVVTYTVKTAIPERDIDSFVITDEVVPELDIVEIVSVTVDGETDGAPQGVQNGNTITVSFTDKDYLQTHAGDEVILTFTAKIAEGADISKYIVEGKKGVPNDASYEYKIGNEATTKDSNEVTVEPPDPEIKKEVKADGVKAEDGKITFINTSDNTRAELLSMEETFTYTIESTLPESLIETFTITDEIKPVLEFVSTKDTVKVVIVENGQEKNAEATVAIDGQKLTVRFTNEKAFLSNNAGKTVKVFFQAKVKANATAEDLKKYVTPSGIANTVEYLINDKPGKESEPAYVIPADPRIEKQVVNAKGESFQNNKKHADLEARFEIYEYTIFTEMPMRKGVVSFAVTDTLEDVLHISSTEARVGVKVGGQNAAATVTIDKATRRTLTVEFDGAFVEDHMGEEVEITFKAQINERANLTKYEKEVAPYIGLYPAAPSEELPRIPNEAQYTITLNDNVGRNVSTRRDWVVQRDADASGKTITRKSDVVTVTPPEEVDITVVKVWEDEDNRQGRRPAEVTVTLWQNGAAMGNYTYIDEQGKQQTVETTVTLNKANDWSAKWIHLPKYAKGTKTPIVYAVVETNVPEGYNVSYIQPVAENSYQAQVTNKYDPEKTSITVMKRWIDQDNRFGTRPASVTAVLQANGQEAARAELNQANGFTHTWENLDKFMDGKEVVYTVVEAPVPEGYTVSITNANTTTFVITNTMQTGTLIVNKVATGLPGGTNPTYTFVVRNASTNEVVATLRITGSGSASVEVAPGTYIVEELGANESTVRNYTLVTTGSGQTVVVRQGVTARADIVNRYTPNDPPPEREVPPDTPINQNPPVEAPEVLGVRRTDSESVLGARRGKTGDKSGARNMIAMFAAGAAAMLLALTGRRKKKDGDEG